LLTQLTGAEDAVVVNNNAGAVMLGLSALAAGREVIVSRGELVEIGGSFRVPDVMRLSGATLVEVGTTNKTRAADFEAAVGEGTALLLQVHRSNFAVVGFTEDTSLAELVALARARDIHCMIDLGSGSLLEASTFASWGLPAEPSVRSVVASGVDLCTFSGDKLLGGPQAGILVGSAAVIERVRQHPLMRALRPDKMSLGALCATLELYRDGRASEVPVVAMLAAREGELRQRAEAMATELGSLQTLRAEVVSCDSAVGGGAMPLGKLPSAALSLQGASAHELEAELRSGEPIVIGRIHDDRFLLDMRTLHDDVQRRGVIEAVRALDHRRAA
jgi:L-seryl-tRNA(Ser) seleniumtransferase